MKERIGNNRTPEDPYARFLAERANRVAAQCLRIREAIEGVANERDCTEAARAVLGYYSSDDLNGLQQIDMLEYTAEYVILKTALMYMILTAGLPRSIKTLKQIVMLFLEGTDRENKIKHIIAGHPSEYKAIDGLCQHLFGDQQTTTKTAFNVLSLLQYISDIIQC